MARLFNGSNQSLSIGVAANLEITGDITLSWWSKTTFSGTNSNNIFGGYLGSGGFTGYGVGIGSGPTTPGSMAYWSNGNGAWRTSAATVNDGNWHHCAVSIKGTGANAGTFYKDGIAGTAFTQTSPGAFTGTKLIGCASNSSIFFAGTLADFAIYNAALTAAEIAGLARGARPIHVRPASLVAWWPLDGILSPEPEFGPSRYIATLSNAPTLANGPPVTLFTPKWRTPPDFLSNKTIYYKTSGTIILPPDFNVSNNKVECLGEGGAGAGGTTLVAGAGGGGGAYASIANYALHGPYEALVVNVGTGGSNSQTIWDTANAACKADFGSNASGATGGPGGTTTFSVGTTKFAGGAGGNSGTNAGGSGGGSAGPSGAGGSASNSGATSSANGGTADNGNQAGALGVGSGGGNPGIAETPQVWTQTSNGEAASPSSGASGAGGADTSSHAGGAAVNYGGGSGGADLVLVGTSPGGAAAPGLIVLTYTPASPPPFGGINL